MLQGSVVQGTLPASRAVTSGASVGATFIPSPVSREQGIERLSRSTTRDKLQRGLMSATGQTASYYHVRYLKSAPFVQATYLQFVVDREWNRILYGNLHHWIKAYTHVLGPTAVATDAGGRVFIAEEGNQRISVFQITGEGAEATLSPAFVISGIVATGDLALDDNGTPLDVSDDALYVIEASGQKIFKFGLGSSSAWLVASHEGFDSPTALLAGKWNGSGNGLLYVVDGNGRKVRLYEDLGNTLSLITELVGDYRQYFQDIKTDHFGNVYLVDNVNNKVLKYTSDLQFLDSMGGKGELDSPGAMDIPFGKIEIEGKGTFWAGFDQLFMAERWAEETGGVRATLGLGLRNIQFLTDPDFSAVISTFTMTDFGDVGVKVFDAANRMVRTAHQGWMVSGLKEIPWDRLDDKGNQVPPGVYRCEIEAVPGYSDNPTISKTQFYLPMYYWQDCGSSVLTNDAMLAQGSAVVWGQGPSQTASEHASAVVYTFTGLNPESEYEVSAEYASNNGIGRIQDLTADGVVIHPTVQVATSPVKTGFLKIPKNTYDDGKIDLSVNARGEGPAIVSQLWFKETGVEFSPVYLDGTTPTAYSLDQNYPNPFNPSTIIRYALPVDGHVTLTIYDIAGREVSTLVNTQQTAGLHEVQFDAGKSLSSGVYFYRVKVGYFTETKKMVLMK
jgi:hypothetical protein